MGTVLLVLVVVLVVAALVFGVASMLTGDDPGLSPVDPDGRALPLPNNRSLAEVDLKTVRFDVTLRGYRMSQVDRVLRRTAYDVGYKDEMIAVLEAEVAALRDGRTEDADLLRKAREAAASPPPASAEIEDVGLLVPATDERGDLPEPADGEAGGAERGAVESDRPEATVEGGETEDEPAGEPAERARG